MAQESPDSFQERRANPFHRAFYELYEQRKGPFRYFDSHFSFSPEIFSQIKSFIFIHVCRDLHSRGYPLEDLPFHSEEQVRQVYGDLAVDFFLDELETALRSLDFDSLLEEIDSKLEQRLRDFLSRAIPPQEQVFSRGSAEAVQSLIEYELHQEHELHEVRETLADEDISTAALFDAGIELDPQGHIRMVRSSHTFADAFRRKRKIREK